MHKVVMQVFRTLLGYVIWPKWNFNFCCMWMYCKSKVKVFWGQIMQPSRKRLAVKLT